MPLPRQVAIERRENIALAVSEQIPERLRESLLISVHQDAFRLSAYVTIKDKHGTVYSTPLGEDCQLPGIFLADLCLRAQ